MSAIPNISEALSRAIYADLQRYLPPGADNSPEGIELRNQRAMTVVAHLLPENAAEADVAVQIVGAQFHARDALRAAVCAAHDPAEVRRYRAQASSMMRQADSGIRTLLRLQAERTKAEKELRPAAMERAGYWFYNDANDFNILSNHTRAVPGLVLRHGTLRKPRNLHIVPLSAHRAVA